MPVSAPREKQPLLGYWGKPTSTLDFCEENYMVTFYAAEFWNTLTNVSMIIPPLVGIVTSRSQGLELRYTASYMVLLVMGIGSACFHASLLYHMQLLEELSMLFTTIQFLYCLLSMGGPADKQTLQATVYLTSLYLIAFIASMTYILFGDPTFYYLTFGVIMMVTAFHTFYNLKTFVHWKYLNWACVSSGCCLIAFSLLILDFIYCSQLRELRSGLGQQHPLAVSSQLHGWVHLLAGGASFLHILISSRIRMTFLGCKTRIKTICGIPYLHKIGDNTRKVH